MVGGVRDYLETLPEAVLTRLFQSPASCLAIFRLLSPLAKAYLLEMVFTNAPLGLDQVDQLVKPAHRAAQVEAIQKLRHLHLIKERYAQKTIVANSAFCDSLRTALTAGPANAKFGVACSDGAPSLAPDKLSEYARTKWESILHFMVQSTVEISGSLPPPAAGALDLLQQSGLMAGPVASRMHITSEGFQFLLQDPNRQVWSLLLHYLHLASQRGRDEVEVLNFIFMLGCLEVGTEYAAANITDVQQQILADVADLGIIYHAPHSQRFTPTPLATILTSEAGDYGAPADNSDAGKPLKGFIILETNFRMYAYTDSTLQICILNLFCELKSRFSNLVVGRISRESVRRAFHNGITADQIIQYLTVHAHDQMKNGEAGHVLAPTISDQIKLWQLELDRFVSNSGFLYRDFATAQEYNLIVTYAQEMGALMWKNDARRMFFVDRDSNRKVLEYVNRKMTA